MEGTSLTSLYIRRVFVQRDYSRGIKIKFETELPNDLEDVLNRTEYSDFVKTLNTIYTDSEKLKFKESCLACLTAYLLYCCIETHNQKTMRKASEFIESQNQKWRDKGVTVIDPVKSGFRVLEFQYIRA